MISKSISELEDDRKTTTISRIFPDPRLTLSRRLREPRLLQIQHWRLDIRVTTFWMEFTASAQPAEILYLQGSAGIKTWINPQPSNPQVELEVEVSRLFLISYEE